MMQQFDMPKFLCNHNLSFWPAGSQCLRPLKGDFMIVFVMHD